jgi:pyroglutamyl-peptidase
MTRILITGFEPFPGAPFNPTGPLVERLMKLRRPALADVERIGHIFPVAYGAVDRDLPQLVKQHAPDALLMFGLAARTPHVRIETRARNDITTIWPDAGHTKITLGKIAPGGPRALEFGPHTALLLRAAQDTGVPSASSRNAGRYLCNYLSWRAIEQVSGARNNSQHPRLAAFIHVPLVPRGTPQIHIGAKPRVTLDDLVDAGEAILLTMIRLARQSAPPEIESAAQPKVRAVA